MPLHDVSSPGQPAGTELDYAQVTAPVTITATTDGNSQGTAIIDGNPIVLDGNQRIRVEFYAPYNDNSAAPANNVYNLYDGTNDLGRIADYESSVAGGGNFINGVTYLTPSAGSHTFHIRAWKTSGTAHCGAGAGGASAYMPAFYRITVA